MGLEGPARRHLAPRLRPLVDGRAGPPSKDKRVTAVKRTGRELAASKGTIAVGPWLTEVGPELLYWVPFLRWLRDRYELDPARMVAVSRGGTSSWYGGLCGGYVDMFEVMDVATFREFNEARWRAAGGQKQMQITSYDKRALKLVRAKGHRFDHILHPSSMFWLLREFTRGDGTVKDVLKHTTFERLQRPEMSNPPDLPEDFVAVKFYFRPSFPDTPTNKAIIRSLLGRIAERTNIVMLNTGLNLDDHAEADPGEIDPARITWIMDGVSPTENLHVQSYAVSRSRAFVGTYGGLSYLAPSYGLPSIAFHSLRSQFLPAHLDIAHRASLLMGGSLTLVDTLNPDLVSAMIEPIATVAAPAAGTGEDGSQ